MIKIDNGNLKNVSNILLVHSLKKNLLSMDSLIQKGNIMIFSIDKYWIIDESGEQSIILTEF